MHYFCQVLTLYLCLFINAVEFLSAVSVNRLGWGCLRPNLRTHFAYRLPQVIHGIFEGKRSLTYCKETINNCDVFEQNWKIFAALSSCA